MTVDLSEQVLHVNGIDLHVTDAGAGEPLLMLHGAGARRAEQRFEHVGTAAGARVRVRSVLLGAEDLLGLCRAELRRLAGTPPLPTSGLIQAIE